MSGYVCAACGEGADDPKGACASCGAPVALEQRFALQSVVGQGAAGTTWRAADLQTGETVAVKEMALRPGTPLHVRDRMAREARVLSELSHDRIPSYVASFEAGSGRHRAFYVVTSFIEGPTLAAEVKARRFTLQEVVDALVEVLDVLDYLHRLAPPVIHRDLKPGNIIRRASDNALVLIDFGAVRDAVTDPRTGGSTIAGTYGFMAPEQFRGVATARTDLYAVGAMAVALLSRRNVIDMVGPDHRLAWREAISAPPGLVALIGTLLADDPVHRPASAAEVRRRLREIDLDAAPASRPSGKSPARAPRRPAPAGDRLAALPSGLPPGTVERLKHSLATDEVVLWAGQPHPDRWPKGGCAMFAFAIPWTAFAIFWTVMASGAIGSAGPIGILFPMFGLPFIGVGLFMLSAPWRAKKAHRLKMYAVTDRQALVVRGPVAIGWIDKLMGPAVERYRGDALRKAERRDHGDGTSSFVLGRSKGNKGHVREHGFMNIGDGDHVQALLDEAADFERRR